MKQNSKHWIIVICSTAACIGLGAGIFAYIQDQNNRKISKNRLESTLRAEMLVGKDTIEYAKDGSVDTMSLAMPFNGDYADDNLSMTASPASIDPSVLGDYSIIYSVTDTNSYGQQVTVPSAHNVTVKDTKPPVIEVVQESYDILVGNSFDPSSVVKSVKDPVDGDIQKVSAAPASNDTGYYMITSTVKTDTEGQYTVAVDAFDNHGNEAKKNITVNVTAQISSGATPLSITSGATTASH